jgi:flagellar protein FlaJ
LPPEVSDIFARLDSSKKKYMKTGGSDEAAKMGPHLVRLSQGAIPEYVKLTKYQEFCWRTIGGAVSVRSKPNPKLELSLLQAHMRMRPVDVSLTLLVTILIMIIPPMLTYVVLVSQPGSKAKTRARDINKRIGPTMSFISAMASADVNIDVIFKELSRQVIYGEIKNEAEWITRDTELLGIDILTAISKAAQRTPSSKFQEFLQGVVTTSTSGGQLKPYFLQKAEQFEKESKLDMHSQLESLGLMAESFVTVVVAFPLFLIVIMAIMAIVPGGGGNGDFTILLLWLVVLLMVPISQFGFIFYIWNSTKEASI